MSTIVRRDPESRSGKARARRLVQFAVALVVLLALAVLALAWQRGGPRPASEIAVPLPAPTQAPA